MPREVRTGYLTGNRACVYVFRVPKDLDAVLAEWERRRALKWTQWRLAGRQHTPRNRKAQGGRVSNSLFKKRNQQKRSAAQEGVPGGEGGPDRDDSRPAPEAAESRPVKGGDKQREEFTPERRAEDLRAAKAWLKAGKARKAPLHAIMEGIARWYPSALAKMAQGSPARQAWAEDWRWKWGHLLE